MPKKKIEIPNEVLEDLRNGILVIEFAVRGNGRVPLDDYLRKLRRGDPSNAKWASKMIEKLKLHGLNFSVAWLKRLQGRKGMFEIIHKQKKIRIIGYRPDGSEGVVVFTHGFLKNQEGAADNQYDLAETIKEEYEEQVTNVGDRRDPKGS